MAAAPESPSIDLLAPDSLPQAVDVLARAFRDNPLNTAVLESRSPDSRERCNAHGMHALLPVARKHGLALAARAGGRVVGVLISAPPNAYPLPVPSGLSRLRILFGQGFRVAQRWGQVFDALDGHHPRDRHWYLATLGVAPEHQGRGVGTALLERWLGRVDADRVPSYLETDRAENVPFYERAGFDVTGDSQVFGVRVRRMRRRARSAAEAGPSAPRPRGAFSSATPLGPGDPA